MRFFVCRTSFRLGALRQPPLRSLSIIKKGGKALKIEVFVSVFIFLFINCIRPFIINAITNGKEKEK